MGSPDPPLWTYSGDPATSLLDEVRFLVQDTDETVQLLTDTEVNYLLDTWMPRFDSVLGVSAVAAGVISRKFAGILTISADGVSVDTSSLSDRYRAIAVDLREEYKRSGDVGLPLLDNILAGFEWDDTIEPLEFGRGMHDNPAAGRQDYGGTRGHPWDWYPLW